MALETYIIDINEFAQISYGQRIVGECYAYEYQPIVKQAKSQDLSIHELLLSRIIAGLWDASPKFKMFVVAQALGQINRLFLCSLRRLSNSFFKYTYSKLSSVNGYIESGQDMIELQQIRPFVIWEPPCTMVALWPKGFNGETDGLRVLDTGTLLEYHSYKDEKGFRNIKDGNIHNPDYVFVPQNSESEITYNGKIYRYLNRFYEIQY